MTQVISAIDFVNSKVNNGEYPTPSVLNRPLLACMDADARLEESVQFIARSMELMTTNNTKFLTHCELDGLDLVGDIKPELSSKPEDVFVYDGSFYSSAFVQTECTNRLSDIVNLDSSLHSLNGWNNIYQGAANASIMTNHNGITITNDKVTGIITPGMVAFSTGKFNVVAGNKISFGATCSTPTNLSRYGIVAAVSISFTDDADTDLGVVAASTTKNNFSGVISSEGVSVPVGATKAYGIISVNFPHSDSKGSVTIANFMVQDGNVLNSYVKTTRTATTLKYANAVDTAKNLFSLFCWSKFRNSAMTTHVGPIGPVFAVNSSNTFNLGVVHDAADAGQLKLRLRYMDGTTTSYGNYITLEDYNKDEYLPCIVRVGDIVKPDSSTITRMEFCIIDMNLGIHKSTLEVPSFPIQGPLDIRVGSDLSTTDYFNCPVSEIKYDEEWINDFELMVIALSKRPFTVFTEEGITMTTLKDYLDSVGINLIANPDGRLGMNHWANIPEDKFRNLTDDNEIGSGFEWFGVANTTDTYIASDKIVVESGADYMLRACMGSVPTTVGSYGVAVEFFNVDDAKLGDTLVQMAMPGLEKQYYELLCSAPADTSYAIVYMYIGTGFESTRATWSRLKFEKGTSGTQFTDDVTPRHALYA